MDDARPTESKFNEGRILAWGGLLVSFVGVSLGIYNTFRKPDPPPAQPDRWLNPGDHFLLMGDSIGVGMQLSLNRHSQAYGSVMSSVVKTGSTMAYWNQHLDQSDLGYPVVVLSLGSNDAVTDPAHYPEQANMLLSALQERGSRVFWFLPPSFIRDNLKPNQEAFRKAILDAGAIELELRGPQPSVSSDPMHLHPTPSGYDALGGQVFDSLT